MEDRFITRSMAALLALCLTISCLWAFPIAVWADEIDWRSLYEAFILGNVRSTGNGEYAIGSTEELYQLVLADMNFDGIPELIFSPPEYYGSTQSVCYSVSGGRVVSKGFVDKVGTLSLYRVKKNRWLRFVSKGTFGEGAKEVTEFSGMSGYTRFSKSTETDGKRRTYYYVNGKSVKKAAYNSKYKAYFKKLKLIATYKNYTMKSSPISAFRTAAAAYKS